MPRRIRHLRGTAEAQIGEEVLLAEVFVPNSRESLLILWGPFWQIGMLSDFVRRRKMIDANGIPSKTLWTLTRDQVYVFVCRGALRVRLRGVWRQWNLDEIEVTKVPLQMPMFEDAPDTRALRVEAGSDRFEVRPLAYTDEAQAIIRRLADHAS